MMPFRAVDTGNYSHADFWGYNSGYSVNNRLVEEEEIKGFRFLLASPVFEGSCFSLSMFNGTGPDRRMLLKD